MFFLFCFLPFPSASTPTTPPAPPSPPSTTPPTAPPSPSPPPTSAIHFLQLRRYVLVRPPKHAHQLPRELGVAGGEKRVGIAASVSARGSSDTMDVVLPDRVKFQSSASVGETKILLSMVIDSSSGSVGKTKVLLSMVIDRSSCQTEGCRLRSTHVP